jgi:hypothetical protein
MKLLICTDGSLSSLQPVGVISYLTFPTNTHITVLGVSESKFDQDHLVASMDIINNELGSKFIVDRKIRVGNPIEEILSEALENEYDLVAVGGGGGQLGILDHKLGSTTSAAIYSLLIRLIIT